MYACFHYFSSHKQAKVGVPLQNGTLVGPLHKIAVRSDLMKGINSLVLEGLSSSIFTNLYPSILHMERMLPPISSYKIKHFFHDLKT